MPIKIEKKDQLSHEYSIIFKVSVFHFFYWVCVYIYIYLHLFGQLDANYRWKILGKLPVGDDDKNILKTARKIYKKENDNVQLF